MPIHMLLPQAAFMLSHSQRSSRFRLVQAGVELDEKSGAVKVNEFSQTSVPSIYAVGDVTDRVNLTPVALMEVRNLIYYINSPVSGFKNMTLQHPLQRSTFHIAALGTLHRF